MILSECGELAWIPAHPKGVLIPTLGRAFALALVIVLASGCSPSGGISRPDDLLWLWANETPPEIALIGPGGATRGTIEVRASLNARDQASVINARLDSAPLVPATSF